MSFVPHDATHINAVSLRYYKEVDGTPFAYSAVTDEWRRSAFTRSLADITFMIPLFEGAVQHECSNIPYGAMYFHANGSYYRKIFTSESSRALRWCDDTNRWLLTFGGVSLERNRNMELISYE